MAKKKEQQKAGTNNYGIIGLAIFTFLLFIGVKNCDFLTNWDDDAYIVNNPSIQQLNWENIKKIFSSFYVSNYQPLSVLSYAIEFIFFKLTPSSYHIVNLLFHITNIFLVYKLFKKLKMSDVVCYTVAILFAIHPTRVESVAWIAERKDVMYAMFYLLSILYYLEYREIKTLKIYLTSLGLFLCCVMSKSMGITLPVILVLIDIFIDRRFDVKKLVNKIPYFIISIIFGLLALYTQKGEAMAIAKDFNIVERIVLIFVAIGKYFLLVFAPFNLSAIQYYPIEPGEAMPIWAYLWVIALLGLLFMAIKVKKYRFEIGFGLLFFFASIGMVLQFVPFGHAIIAERYTYLPYLGLFFIIGVFVDQFLKDKSKASMVYTLGAGFVLFMAVLTYQRISVWQSSITLFSDVVEKFPNSSNAYWYRGNVYREYKQHDLAIKDYTKAIELNPKYDKAYFNRGTSLAALERNEEALPDYDKSIELNPDYTPAYYNKANSLIKLKRYDEAKSYYQKTIARDSTFKVAYLGIADIFIAKNEPQNAISIYEKYLLKSPDDSKALHSFAIALYNNNNRDKACVTWKKASELGNTSSQEFLNKFCK
jgi:tetratricopeptide (TPR) repeat protein